MLLLSEFYMQTNNATQIAFLCLLFVPFPLFCCFLGLTLKRYINKVELRLALHAMGIIAFAQPFSFSLKKLSVSGVCSNHTNVFSYIWRTQFVGQHYNTSLLCYLSHFTFIIIWIFCDLVVEIGNILIIFWLIVRPLLSFSSIWLIDYQIGWHLM